MYPEYIAKYTDRRSFVAKKLSRKTPFWGSIFEHPDEHNLVRLQRLSQAAATKRQYKTSALYIVCIGYNKEESVCI